MGHQRLMCSGHHIVDNLYMGKTISSEEAIGLESEVSVGGCGQIPGPGQLLWYDKNKPGFVL